jgi:hypothetical protein
MAAGACRGECDPSKLDTAWSIEAGILNALWGHAWPRLVARYWRGEISLDAATTAVHLAGMVPALKVPGVTSKTFDDYMDELADYLGGANVIPIRVMGEGGFDFVLSDQGLDLFMPEKPLTRTDLVRYYMYRQTGRPSLGVPRYMSKGTAAIGLDRPTGPSQVQVDLKALDGLVAGTPCAMEIIHCLELHGVPAHALPEHVPLSLEAYQCLLEPTRCWQISGAVFRGILTELPRVVATAWMEDLSYSTSPPPTSYTKRFARSGNRGLRSIFEERLETSLPKKDRMHFQKYPSTNPQADVRITNRGMYFPAIPDIPSTSAMFDEMKVGRAGNPVFTDSRRTL